MQLFKHTKVYVCVKYCLMLIIIPRVINAAHVEILCCEL